MGAVHSITPSETRPVNNSGITAGDHLTLKADPIAVQLDSESQSHLPLGYQTLTSQVARHLIHVERRTDANGNLTEVPRLNRKGQRKEAALERRKTFRPATRPLNKRENRERQLNEYEDSLYPERQARSKPRVDQRPAQGADFTDANPPADTGFGPLPLGTSRQRRLARRAEIRRRAAVVQANGEIIF